MTETTTDEPNSHRKDFICGVVEGFYGRPWTTEQRKDLFQKLKKWGMDMYVYAPKDDYKHRAYWRELYTVEEAEHLTSLISAAKAQGIIFCYALSPGLDITYSSQKEITTLKRKLEQVSQFGCTCFALLFDDIEPEMSEADKQIFQSFAHAQVSVTNEIHQHLGCPRFLLCPTQYCSTRAVPSVNSSEYLNTLGTKLSQQIDIMWTAVSNRPTPAPQLCPTQYCSTRAVPSVNSSEYLNTLGTKLSQQIDIMWTAVSNRPTPAPQLCPTQYCSTRAVPSVNSSEYLNTLGTKLSQQIDIMWTGPKVISKVLTTEAIEEITQVLRRPPVIWDNLHANDYDQKRIFLGPYCGRSPELIPLLRGVLTNPNCEYNANMIPIWTLAHWASCSLDAPAHMEAVSWDIKLERESEQGVCEDEAPLTLGKHVYHHRQALRQAINEWLPEFSIPKSPQGPVIKPQPTITVPPVPIIPILPSVNTCMSLMTATSNTSTTSTADMAPAIPTVNTSQLQALADGCSSGSNDRPMMSTRHGGHGTIPTVNTSQLQALADGCSSGSNDRPMMSTRHGGHGTIPTVNTSQLQALADGCSSGSNDRPMMSTRLQALADGCSSGSNDRPMMSTRHGGHGTIPTVNTSQLQALADGCSSGSNDRPMMSTRHGGHGTIPTVNTSQLQALADGCSSGSNDRPMMSTRHGGHGTIPTVNTSQLQALADGCSSGSNDRPMMSTRVSPIETFNPVPNPVMNSLVSPTKVILNESIPNPIIPIASSNISLPSEIPVSTLPVPILGLKALEGNVNKNNHDMDKTDGDLIGDGGLENFEMKKDKEGEGEDADQIIVDDVESAVEEQQRNGDMSVGDTPQTLSPSRPSLAEAGGEPLDVDPPSTAATDPDVVMNDGMSENGSMQVEPSHSPLSTDMMVEPAEPTEVVDEPVENEDPSIDPNALVADDLLLLCDLFYLPFEHGSRGLRLLHDFNWLSTHAASLLPRGNKPETSEWRRRRSRFAWWMCRTRRLARRLAAANNQELHAELQPYVWELCAVLALLDGFLRWLELGKYPTNIATNTQGSYTWFSKGWREAFESGSQEPWVFRGGLTADLRRLLPVECTSDALRTLPPPTILPLTIRPYCVADEEAVCAICHKTCRDGSDCSDLFPADLQTLPADRLVAPFLTLVPELCMVIEDDEECIPQEVDQSGDDEEKQPVEPRVNGMKPEIVGYACAVLNSKEFYKRQEIAWIPEMCTKYPEQLTERQDLSQAAKECVRHFHQFSVCERAPDTVTRAHPALLTCCVLAACRDPLAPARLLTCVLAALRAHGASGVHVCINATDHYLHQFYSKLGFVELQRGACGRVYLARGF
ncbi:hypothetical protein PYW07_009951 [Mythimna separata]|uniref:GH84 domain-containing protein n=1 Tax=Mythimna separata TaxID=271217 RepID=A0AAD7YI79_MYTSE|nr:hypothetical protein PYW07_009951 [Mythimna separata]